MPGSLYKKDGKLLLNSSKLTTSSNCCCADNVCRHYYFPINPNDLSWGMTASLTASGVTPANCTVSTFVCNPAVEINYFPAGLSGSFSCQARNMLLVEDSGSAISDSDGVSINFGLAPNSSTDYDIPGNKIREYKNYTYLSGSCINNFTLIDVVSGISGNMSCSDVNGICLTNVNVGITRYQVSFNTDDLSVYSITGVAIFGYSIVGTVCDPTKHTLVGTCLTASSAGDLYQIRQGCGGGPLYSYVNNASANICVTSLPPGVYPV